jgi:glycosyltransferase involved in cell wall biosynthesis
MSSNESLPMLLSQETPDKQPINKRFISIFTPCYNEEDNVREWYQAVKAEMDKEENYTYEHVFIDNHSTDKTWDYLKQICAADKNVRAIRNARNFGAVRSSFYGMLQTKGECMIGMVCDFQDPAPMIHEYLRRWESGDKVVLAVKTQSHELPLMYWVRKIYYNLLDQISQVRLINNATGSGLYDRDVIKVFSQIDDPYPYVRGLVSELGFRTSTIPFVQPVRHRGITKHNFFSLYDIAMLGLTSHSKAPIRLATLCGFMLSGLSMGMAFFYLIMKLAFWYSYPAGIVPVLICLLFFSSVQLFFIGILGEYISAIHVQTLNRPLVIEEERINCED